MPPPLGEIRNRATHWRCIDTFRPADIPIDVEVAGNLSLMEKEAWFEKALKDAHDAE
ncbi:hypothetical protein B0H10DRAFT_2209838 [Mycena sp. CBHHK59/15]|nr:hypothetical protein B0H10DRAFT_2209838 [Mycena sp. CBHHK59/15]